MNKLNKFNSFLKPHIQAYISYQKASMRWNEVSYERNLAIFERYCLKYYPEATVLSQDMVNGWCCKRQTESNNSCRSRIYVIAGLIRYLRNRGETNVTEPVIPKEDRRTYIPHAFTETELTNFFKACDSITVRANILEHRKRRITIPVFFRLLYSSGMRTNEARMLKVSDVDLENGVINISSSKGYGQHYVALHDSMLELLKNYDAAIRKYNSNRTYFFPAKGDSFHRNGWVYTNFRLMWNKYNCEYATAYELRHNYAIENINRYTNEGFGFNSKLVYLSKSMGHKTLESTRYYYSLVPGIADILEEKTGIDFDRIVPEVEYEEFE